MAEAVEQVVLSPTVSIKECRFELDEGISSSRPLSLHECRFELGNKSALSSPLLSPKDVKIEVDDNDTPMLTVTDVTGVTVPGAAGEPKDDQADRLQILRHLEDSIVGKDTCFPGPFGEKQGILIIQILKHFQGCTNCGKNVEPNRHLCTMPKHVLLADDKMANISLDVLTFIAQNLPKYHFQSSLDYTFLSLNVSSIIF